MFAKNDPDPVLPLIAIDGDFDDWGELSPAYVAEASTDANAAYESLYNIKFTRDENYIYFYFEFSGETYEMRDHNTGNVVNAFVIMLDVDEDPTTGWNGWLWNPCGADYLIEGYLEYEFEGTMYYFEDVAYLHAFVGPNPDEWAWDYVDAYGFIQASEVQTLDNGHHALEGSIRRNVLPANMPSLKVGVYASNSEWAETGILPQVTNDPEEGPNIPGQMLEVPLYEEPTPIVNNNYQISYLGKNSELLGGETVRLHFPEAPEIEGFTFLGWRPIAEIIADNAFAIEAVYEAEGQQSLPAEVSVPGSKSQKLIRDGKLYILRDSKTYTVTGQEVK